MAATHLLAGYPHRVTTTDHETAAREYNIRRGRRVLVRFVCRLP